MTAELRAPRSSRWPARLAWVLWALAVLGLVLVIWLDQLLVAVTPATSAAQLRGRDNPRPVAGEGAVECTAT